MTRSFKLVFQTVLLLLLMACQSTSERNLAPLKTSTPASQDAPAKPQSTATTPPTETAVPPTATSVPPTETPVPPTETPVPPTETPVPQGFQHENSAKNLQLFFETLRKVIIAEDIELAAEMTQSIIPNEACVRQGLHREVAEADVMAIMEMFEGLTPALSDTAAWAGLLIADPARSQVNVHAATREEIILYEEGSVAWQEFPGGVHDLADTHLRPEATYYEVEYVEPDKDAGMKFHLVYWQSDHWCMLGPIWRAVGD